MGVDLVPLKWNDLTATQDSSRPYVLACGVARSRSESLCLAVKRSGMFAMCFPGSKMQHQAEMVPELCSIGADTVNADVI